MTVDADRVGSLEYYLGEFKGVAAAGWYKEDHAIVKTYYEFFQRFFAPEHLAKLEWPDVQAVGQHLHAMGMAIARGNAFGRPNHAIEHYRTSFEYFARGDDPLDLRLDRLRKDDAVQLKYIGESAWGEMAGQYFAAQHMLYNDRSQWSLSFLGIPYESGASRSFGTRFLAFSEAVQPIVEAY